MMSKDIDLLDEIKNAVLDLQRSEFQSFDRPLKALARLLHHSDLQAINRQLVEAVDFNAFMAASEATGGGMAGSHKLVWPDDQQQVLGLTLLLIDELAANPDYAVQFCFKYFHPGSKIIAGIHMMVAQVFVPFIRDYKTYVLSHGQPVPRVIKSISKKIFIVHGHDQGVREAVARFLERIEFEPIILHEQANQGHTIIEKIEKHGDVGFAIVLLTPDDEGCKKGDALKPRARQNVVLELGYFIAKLGRNRVCALKRGEVELPSDFGGVVYESYDESGGWKQSLAKELRAAGYEIDWNKVMP